jgi:serine/threonine protein kinase
MGRKPTKLDWLRDTSKSGIISHDDIFERVHRNDTPSYLNDATKLRMIVSLMSGLTYLHGNGIVHRELKPSDLIVQADGTLKISGYETSILDEYKYARPSQVGSPSYMAPEVYDDAHEGAKVRDPKSDVFSFGLILHELLSGQKTFPTSMSAATIMRKALSSRPTIPDRVYPILRELISRNWHASMHKRPTVDILWKRHQDVKFQLFPSVTVILTPLSS